MLNCLGCNGCAVLIVRCFQEARDIYYYTENCVFLCVASVYFVYKADKGTVYIVIFFWFMNNNEDNTQKISSK